MTARIIGPRKPSKGQQAFSVAVVRQTDECILWPYHTVKGYGYVGWNNEEVGVHQLACLLYHGEAPSDRHEVAHACGNRACFNPRHVRWATRAENMQDAVAMGRTNRGTRHPAARLSEDSVRSIRLMHSQGLSYQRIATAFAVSEGTIGDCVRRSTWAWVA